jgi:uncharacterized protein YjbI with pentapeptide repeats
LPNDIDISTLRFEDKDKKEIPYERADIGQYGIVLFSGEPITWKEFYETHNYKTKCLRFTDIQTTALSHLFAGWDLEGSRLPLVSNLANAIVTNCCLYVPRKTNEVTGQYEIDKKITSKAFEIFASTRSYKEDRLVRICLCDVDLRNGDFHKKDVSQMEFFNCTFFDSTSDYKFLFEDATISSNNPNYLSKLPYGINKEQLYETKCFKDKKLNNISFFLHLPELDLSNQNLMGSRFSIVEGYKLDDASIDRTSIVSITKEQLYSTLSYKNGNINNSWFGQSDFSNAILSNLNLTGCMFEKCNLQNANFQNSIITNCNFSNSTNLIIDQIKSTWNYKSNRMTGIKLPNEIQKELE